MAFSQSRTHPWRSYWRSFLLYARQIMRGGYLCRCSAVTWSNGVTVDATRSLSAMSWSENLFTFANSARDACVMMMVWSSYLWCMCGLKLKAGSLEVISSSTNQYPQTSFEMQGVKWRQVSTMLSLGQCITYQQWQSSRRSQSLEA